MPLTRSMWIAANVLVAAFAGCSRPPASEPASYHAKLDKNLERDRADFVAKTNGRLADVDRQIGLMQAKIDAESPYVSEDKRADWMQQLFDLRQERRQLEAELKRAETASPPEWKAMRGNLGVMMDSLEAAVQQMAYEVRTAFSR